MKKEKVLYWSPRILAILAILFIMMFSLDCFEGKWNLGEQLTCLFMHNILIITNFLLFRLLLSFIMQIAIVMIDRVLRNQVCPFCISMPILTNFVKLTEFAIR